MKPENIQRLREEEARFRLPEYGVVSSNNLLAMMHVKRQLPELLDDWERMRDALETVWIYARNEPGCHHDSHENMADAIVAKESCILCLIEDVARKACVAKNLDL